MTAAYKYYRDEAARHREADSLKYSLSECIQATRYLIQRVGIQKRLDIRTNLSAKPGTRMADPNTSWFMSAGRHGPAYISYGHGMMTALTVAHEVAHFFQSEDESRRYTEWWASPAAQRLTPKFVSQKHHGPGHRKWVDRCVVWLRAGGHMGAIREVA